VRVQSKIAAALAAVTVTAAAATAAAVVPAAAAKAGGQESTLEAAFLGIVDPAPPSQIQARLTVPAVRCTGTPGIEDATAQVGALPGPAGRARAEASIASGGVNTPGLVTADATVEASCLTGSAAYQAKALGVPLAMTVSPGDKVLLAASFDPSTQRRTATVDDLTTGVSLTKARTDQGGFAPFSDFAGVKRSGRKPIPDFGVIHWSKVTINNAPISSAVALFGFSLIRSIAHPVVLIRTSPLSPAGDAFTNTWIKGS